MDGSAKEIVFTETGCNFCDGAKKELGKINIREWGEIYLDMINQKGKYNCIVGLSGGVDSSYALLKLMDKGLLNPLCFSIDNGWNDPIADENIMRLVEGLKVPFFRYTIDLNKFKDLQSAFLQAGLINVEIPSDHIIVATAYKMASDYRIKYIVSGGNLVTESIMPFSWSYPARDLTHIKDVYFKMKGKKLGGLPLMSLWNFNFYRWVKGIKVINILDWFDYNREEAIKELSERFGWKDYGAKHEESIWTKWFQSYYLFEKFGIDKRKAHLSSLIVSGQITRQKALEELAINPVYPLLGIEKRVIEYPKRNHFDFKTDKWYDRFSKIIRLLK